MAVSRVGFRNLTLPERRSLSTSPWDLESEVRMPTRLNKGEGRVDGEGIESCTRFDPPGYWAVIAVVCTSLGFRAPACIVARLRANSRRQSRGRVESLRALSGAEQLHIMEMLLRPRFDLALAEIYACLLDEGVYWCSIQSASRHHPTKIAGSHGSRRNQTFPDRSADATVETSIHCPKRWNHRKITASSTIRAPIQYRTKVHISQ